MFGTTVSFLIGTILVLTDGDANEEALARLDDYMDHLAARVTAEGPIDPAELGAGSFGDTVVQSQNLAEKGQYAEAAQLLLSLIQANVEPGWKEMLETRVEILQRGASAGKLSLEDYQVFFLEVGPQWFHLRLRPILTLWNREDLPKTEKLLLIASLLEKQVRLAAPSGRKEALIGAATVLEAVPRLSDTNSATAAQSLVRAADARFKLGERDRAQGDLAVVLKAYPDTSSWYDALFRSETIKQDAGDCAGAIRDFTKLLKTRPKGQQRPNLLFLSWSNFAYHSAVRISICYEELGDNTKALGFASKALTAYPFHNGCGTCEANEARRLELRIESLREKAPHRAR